MVNLSRLVQFLRFVRIVDSHDNTVSLTALAMWVVLVKLALLRTVGFGDLAAFFLAVAQWQGRKIHRALTEKAKTPPVDVGAIHDSIKELKEQVSKVGTAISLGGRKFGA